MNTLQETKPVQQPGPCLILLSPWRKRRSIFTNPSPVRPPLITYPMNSNPAAVMTHRPQLRLVRLSPFAPLVGPPFPNPQAFNSYAEMPEVLPPNNAPVFSSPSEPQQINDSECQYETVLQQQWQPPENFTFEGQNSFSSTINEECGTEEVTSTSSPPKDLESIVIGNPEIDSYSDNVIQIPETSESGNGNVTSTDEAILNATNNLLYEVEVDKKITGMDSECEVQFPDLKGSYGDENIMFNTVDEPLTDINFSKGNIRIPSPDSPSISLPSDIVRQLDTGLKVADDKQEEVIKAAKSLFSKRTRTLYHWLYPDTSKNKLKATVSAAWDTLPDNEKHFYVSQVLGRFGLQASSLMINPQLDGIKGLTTDGINNGQKIPPKNNAAEAQRAVEELFASCDDAVNWASYPRPKRRNATERRRKRKSTRSSSEETGGRARLGAVDSDELDEETVILKRMREAKLEVEFEEDIELSSELEKFRLISESEGQYKHDEDDDFWRRTPDPEDLFSQMDF